MSSYHETSIELHGYCPAHRPCDDCDAEIAEEIAEAIIKRLHEIMPVHDFATVKRIVREELGA